MYVILVYPATHAHIKLLGWVSHGRLIIKTRVYRKGTCLLSVIFGVKKVKRKKKTNIQSKANRDENGDRSFCFSNLP